MKIVNSHFRAVTILCAAAGFAVGFRVLPLLSGSTPTVSTPEPQAPFTDYRHERPGTTRKIALADLPEPYRTESADNRAHIVPRPADAWPKALPGFTVTQYVTGLENPRLIRRAPNGDLFVAESEPGRIRVLRGAGANGKAQTVEVFATGLTQPFGIAFYPPGPDPQYVYVANTGSVVRFPYRNGDLKARGPAQTLVPDIPSGGRLTGGGHWTRIWPLPATAARCSSRSARIRMTTTPTITHRNTIAPIFWSSTRMAPVATSTHTASVILSALPRIPRQVNCGLR